MNKTALQDTACITDSAVKIKRALLSVSDKSGLVEFAQGLEKLGIQLISTGGTARTLKEAGLNITDISDYTGFPEIMDGRVKTLHPKVHGGLLARRDKDDHKRAMADNDISDIDLLVANLYPFSETVASGADEETCIENIDIGGPAMIRAAAKNHEFVTIATSPQDYDTILTELKENKNCTSFPLRRKLAIQAYSLTARYDAAIVEWFNGKEDNNDFPAQITVTAAHQQTLRYGENPHQKAALYVDGTNRPGVAVASQLQGKELSYNNLNDTDAAFELVSEFIEPAVAIIKHANPCGVALGENTIEAYTKALQCDPVSAFGGIIALNRPLNAETATEIIKVFSEVIIAPSIEHDALSILETKKNLRVLTTGDMAPTDTARQMIKSIAGGYLLQDADNKTITKDDLTIVTDRDPTDQELEDMLFAFHVAKHVKSNAIIYAKDGATVGIGAGQMSRIDSSRIAARKAEDAAAKYGWDHPLTKGSVVASDAFFPFPDGLLAAADAGVTAVIQPGGSIRDEEVIQAANERGLAMAFTGIRHFRH